MSSSCVLFFFFQAEDGIRDSSVTGVQTCALPIWHNLFLRWVVRAGDGVDLGLWTALSPRHLIVPLDTHMARLGKWLGLTSRSSADWRMAEEITGAFRAVCPEDPVRFDFALTRIGI